MGKKKQSQSSFYFFITEKMRTEAAKGRPVMGGFKEASHKFGSEWTEMSTDQRVPYVKLANEAKGKDKSNLHNKFTTTGESYAQVNERARQKQAAQQKMESFIRNLTSGPDADNRNYIFMKVNYSVEEIREDGARVFWPVEIAMAVFNLKEGLQSFYTTFVDTVAVPCGYSSLAVETANDTLIPLPGDSSFPEDAKNYKEILRKIFGFLNHWIKDKEGYDTDHERVVFCLDSEVKPIRTGLQWMADKLEEFDNEKYCYLVEDLKIYSISKLILGMAQEAYKLNPSYDNCAVKYQVEGSAESIILKGSYDFSDELTCMFHCSEERRIKMQNCAQNIVLRRVFLLFDEFIQPNAYRYEKRDRHKIEFVNKVDTLCPVIKKHVRPKVVPVNIVLPDWLKDEPEVSLEDPQLSASASNDDDNRPQTSDERRNENQEDVDVPSEQVPDDVERDWLNDSRDPGRPDVSMEEPQLSPPASNSYDNRPRTGVKRRNDVSLKVQVSLTLIY
ncbi:unnamed protein product [Orchesella dallaii]|uniref:HMG box domain-containing protein n=1 Tax=Orchesella dallaii TaxID=48710 RepID=A0ABP1PWP4_9HEXA